MIKHSIRYFDNKEIRAIWDDEKSLWWYSATDFIRVLVDAATPRKYWNTIKARNPELSSFCGQLQMFSSDGKKYSTEVINAEGLKKLISIIPSKNRKALRDWLSGLFDPLDVQSKKKAHELFCESLIEDIYIGKAKSLQQIHAYLFEGLYSFAGKIRTKTISKNGFTFANDDFILQTLEEIDAMPDSTFEEIVSKYVEMNIAHPFMEGNGRATRIWLDLLLKKRLNKCIDWSKIKRNEYLTAMRNSPSDDSQIRNLLKGALTSEIDNREMFIKGIDTSYYYEEDE